MTISLNESLISAFGMQAFAERIPYQRSVLRQVSLLQFLREHVHMDVLTPWLRDVLFRNGFTSARVSLYPSPMLDPANFQATKRTRDSTRPMHFAMVGRLSTEKGLLLLIEALERMGDLRQEFIITLLGRHDDAGIVQRLKGLNARGFQLEFPGEAPRDQVNSLLADADYLLFLSIAAEMAPLVIQEALQADVPVVFPDSPAAAAFISRGINGIGFKRNDAVDLAGVLSDIVRTKSRLAFHYCGGSSQDSVYDYYRHAYQVARPA